MSDSLSSNGPSLAEHVVLGGAALAILEQHSRLPEVGLFVALLCGGTIVGVGVAYVVRLTVVLHKRWVKSTFLRVQDVAGWLVFPTVVALLLFSASTHWPATIRFSLSKPSFENLVAQAYSGERLEGFPRRVGLYWITYVYDFEFDYTQREGRIGFVTGEVLIDPCGLQYDPHDLPTESHWLTTRIAPCWYVTEW